MYMYRADGEFRRRSKNCAASAPRSRESKREHAGKAALTGRSAPCPDLANEVGVERWYPHMCAVAVRGGSSTDHGPRVVLAWNWAE
jgi:hypothetical protein